MLVVKKKKKKSSRTLHVQLELSQTRFRVNLQNLCKDIGEVAIYIPVTCKSFENNMYNLRESLTIM